MNRQEMIRLLKDNGIVPDVRCSIEDLEALISYEIGDKHKCITVTTTD